ncbi:hypothetical protein SEA_CECE_243 [Microbacterium phage Cece]|nr:hypothetical protein SEA_CECE_243 [Microbacterium phage Cece]
MISDDTRLEPADMVAFERLFDARTGSYSWVEDHVVRKLFPIDPDTEMPSLPDGYFWRVGQLHSMSSVALMHQTEHDRPLYVTERWGPLNLLSRQRREIRRQAVERTLSVQSVKSGIPDARKAIQDSAVHILSWLTRDLDREFSSAKVEEFYGDYHPKPDTMEG